MTDPRLLELEQQLLFLEVEVRLLRTRRSSQFILGLLGLVVMAGISLVVMGGITPVGAQPGKDVAHPLTVLEAPVDIQGKNKQSILRIEDDPPRLSLLGDKGTVRMRIFNQGGGIQLFNSPSASNPFTSSFGIDQNGDGMLILTSKDGKEIAKLGKDGVSTFNDGGKVIARLGPSPKGGTGFLAIGDQDGDTMVDAGILDDGRGIVRAYPHNPKAVEVLRGNYIIIGAKK